MLSGLEPADLPDDAIEVGRIADAWGIKGWFKVLPYSASPEALFSSKRWFLLPTQKGIPTFAGVAKLLLKEAKEHSGTVVASAHDVLDRNAAEALKGARIFISRSSFPSVGDDEFYWVDLIGLTVINREGILLGHVHELLSTGPQTVLVLHDAESVNHEQPEKILERMIPFVSAYVDSVDLAAKRITVDWQLDY